MRLVIVAILCLALGAGGATAYFMYLAPPAGNAQGAETSILSFLDPGPTFIEFENITIPIFVDDRLSQQITVSLAIEVSRAGQEGRISGILPRIEDAFLRSFHSELNADTVSDDEPISIALLKSIATEAVTAEVGADGFDEVLIQAIDQRFY